MISWLVDKLVASSYAKEIIIALSSQIIYDTKYIFAKTLNIKYFQLREKINNLRANKL